MTAIEMYEILNNIKNINPKSNEPIGGDIIDLYYAGKESDAIICIQEYFNCDLNLAKETLQILKSKIGAPPSPQQIARANAEARELLNKPHCPICNSTNLSKISTTKKVVKVAAFGIFGMGDNGKTWKCNNCGSKF